MCPKCGGPLGGRWNKRCYRCHPGGLKRNGEYQPCKTCGKQIYVQPNEVTRGEGKYCSYACKDEAQRLKGPGYRYKRPDGYIAVYYPTHPDARAGGWILEHRLVAEQKYGRRIKPNEHVHHINSVRDDNSPDNLEIIDASSHAGISNKRGQRLRQEQRAELERLRAKLAEYEQRYGPLDQEE